MSKAPIPVRMTKVAAPRDLRPSTNAVGLIQHYEGLRLTVYDDGYHNRTGGWGHLTNLPAGTEVSLDLATTWFNADLGEATFAVRRLVKPKISQDAFDALVDFTFNLGEGSLQESTLLKMVNAGNDRAPLELLRWDHADGHEVAGLLKRRSAELVLWLTGELYLR